MTMQQIAERAAQECFTEAYRKPETLEDRKEQGLGIKISQWAKWDCDKIARVCFSALEDCNFHSLAGIIHNLISLDYPEMQAKIAQIQAILDK